VGARNLSSTRNHRGMDQPSSPRSLPYMLVKRIAVPLPALALGSAYSVKIG
jgi:hypothetical protein